MTNMSGPSHGACNIAWTQQKQGRLNGGCDGGVYGADILTAGEEMSGDNAYLQIF